MGDAAGQGAQGFHLLDLGQFALQRHPVPLGALAFLDFGFQRLVRFQKLGGALRHRLLDDARAAGRGEQILKQQSREQEADRHHTP